MDPCGIQPQANATFPSSMAWLDDRRLAFKLRDSHNWSRTRQSSTPLSTRLSIRAMRPSLAWRYQRAITARLCQVFREVSNCATFPDNTLTGKGLRDGGEGGIRSRRTRSGQQLTRDLNHLNR